VGSAVVAGAAGLYWIATRRNNTNTREAHTRSYVQRNTTDSPNPAVANRNRLSQGSDAVSDGTVLTVPNRVARLSALLQGPEGESFGLLIMIIVICISLVYSSIDRTLPTDYRLFTPLLMTGVGFHICGAGRGNDSSSSSSPSSSRPSPVRPPTSAHDSLPKLATKRRDSNDACKNDEAVGRWKLERNVRFSDFLKWVGYGYMTRQIALSAAVNVTIEKVEESGTQTTKNVDAPTSFRKKVESSFYSTDEVMVLDDQWRDVGKLRKKHELVVNEDDDTRYIRSTIKGKTHEWSEEVRIRGDGTMENVYIFKDAGVNKRAVQTFSRRV